MWRRVLVGGVLAVGLAACDSEREEGDQVSLFGGQVSTAGITDDGQIVGLMSNLSRTAVENAPQNTGGTAELRFPEEVRQGSFGDHLTVTWTPVGGTGADAGTTTGGNPGGTFALRHSALTREESAAITCTAGATVPEARLPQGFAVDGDCVGGEGFTARNTATGAQGIAFGYDGSGALVAIIPIVSQDALLRRQSFSLDVPRPTELGRAARFPTRFGANFRSDLDAWEFTLSDFEDLQ